MIYKDNITLVLADDHPILLKGLYEELVRKEYTVLAKATNGEEALKKIMEYKPTIALLDIDMPKLTGFEVVKEAKERGSKTQFIVLSFHKENEYVLQAKALQISGYLLKEDSFTEIELCIEKVSNGEEYFSRSFEFSSLKNATDEMQKINLLTSSEITILKLIAKQHTTNEIADFLSVSTRTVEKHRSNIKEKLRLEGGANALIKWALVNKNTILEQ